MSSDIIQNIALSVGSLIAGVVISYYFYKKSIKEKEPCWVVRSNNLIKGHSSRLDYLTISYKKKKVENLTISKVLFWNDGTATIDKVDLETVNPLRIVGADGVVFFDAIVQQQNNGSSQCNVKISESHDSVFLTFEYLDHKQGCVLQVVHTGTSSDDIRITGDIKGVKLLQNKFPKPRWIKFFDFFENINNKVLDRYPKVVAWFTVIWGGISLLLSLLYLLLILASFYFAPNIVTIPIQTLTTSFVTYGLTGLITFAIGTYLLRRLQVVPRGLESFDDSFR